MQSRSHPGAMCCCVRVERAVHAPADAGCAPRSLAHRLRRIGDELEMRWAARGDKRDNNNNNNKDKDADDHNHKRRGGEASRVSAKSMHLLCTAIQVTVLVLFVGWRHL